MSTLTLKGGPSFLMGLLGVFQGLAKVDLGVCPGASHPYDLLGRRF